MSTKIDMPEVQAISAVPQIKFPELDFNVGAFALFAKTFEDQQQRQFEAALRSIGVRSRAEENPQIADAEDDSLDLIVDDYTYTPTPSTKKRKTDSGIYSGIAGDDSASDPLHEPSLPADEDVSADLEG